MKEYSTGWQAGFKRCPISATQIMLILLSTVSSLFGKISDLTPTVKRKEYANADGYAIRKLVAS